jgi:ABC-2 type transport system ATP-binding protein
MVVTLSKILINNLTKSYGSTIAVKDLSLEINEGEIFGFLGRNGAGKTTTIRCILNILLPDNGTIHINESLISRDNSDFKDNIGYMPGEINIPVHYTVEAFLDYMAALKKVESNRIEEIVQRFDIPTNKKIKELSTGNKRKVAIAVAWMHDPEIFILDEPSAGLDPLYQQELYDLIFEEKAKGKTIFFSSHNLDEVQKICDRVAIINKGKLVSLVEVKDLAKSVPRELILKFKAVKEKDIEVFGSTVTQFNAEINEVTLSIDSSVSLPEIMKKVSKLDLIDFTYPPASLESYFMAEYEKEGK